MTPTLSHRPLLIGLVALTCGMLLAGEDSDSHKAACQSALEEFNDLIGGWRGAAQPQRNSTRGAWTEKAEWVWDLKSEQPALKYDIKGGKAIASARLTYDPEHKQYELTAVLPDKSTRTYTGQLDDSKLILESEADEADKVHRLTVTRLNEKRTLVLLEQRPAAAERYSRVVEIGYTREGTNLAVEGADGPECIVTGGKGTSQVSYKGKTYWVCCSGCREAFEADPEGILKEAAERAAKKKQKK